MPCSWPSTSLRRCCGAQSPNRRPQCRAGLNGRSTSLRSCGATCREHYTTSALTMLTGPPGSATSMRVARPVRQLIARSSAICSERQRGVAAETRAPIPIWNPNRANCCWSRTAETVCCDSGVAPHETFRSASDNPLVRFYLRRGAATHLAGRCSARREFHPHQHFLELPGRCGAACALDEAARQMGRHQREEFVHIPAQQSVARKTHPGRVSGK